MMVHLFVIIEQRLELRRATTNDGKDNREAEPARPVYRLGRTTYGYPYIQVVIYRAGQYLLVDERRTELSLPVDGLCFIDLEQQFQLFFKQLIIISKIVAK